MKEPNTLNWTATLLETRFNLSFSTC